MPAFTTKKDPYLAHIKDYTWGSNSVKSIQGNMFYNLISFGIDPTKDATAENAAMGYIHYIHGVNPLNMVYLSNMYRYGAENGVNEFYHSWFTDKSPKWDRVGKSTYGPAPGFLTGGPNPSYNWDGCCPGGCGSAANNGVCTSESIAPPKNQPVQKSYKDFNTSWPLNSWEVTENSCGYQVNYIRLLSKFVDLSYDCSGEKNGTAFIDAIGKCAGGNTGIEPETDPDKYTGNARELKLNSDFPEIRIFPNPGNRILNIEFTGNKDFSFKIVTMDGTVLMESCISESCSFDIAHLVPGIYSVIISSETGTSTQKLVKI
jgi:endoglucanase